MTKVLLNQEPPLRLAVFLAALVALTLWELATPRRWQEISRVIRWANNLAIAVMDTSVLRRSFPILAVEPALITEQGDWVLFNTLDSEKVDEQ